MASVKGVIVKKVKRTTDLFENDDVTPNFTNSYLVSDLDTDERECFGKDSDTVLFWLNLTILLVGIKTLYFLCKFSCYYPTF